MKTFFQKTAFALLLAFCLPILVFSQKATAVTGVSITVEDLDREVEFFTKVLDFQKIKEETQSGEKVVKLYGLPEKTTSVQVVTLRLGDEKIQLMDFDGEPSRPISADTRSNDLWFQHLAIVVSDMDAAYQKLLKNKVVHVSTAPQTLPDYLPNAAGIKAFYFRDPEGHNLELIWFPTGKGNLRWQPNPQSPIPNPLFQGIDHTAIGIADTDSSMAFYRDALGLVHGGHSENYGTEQEHLNQVFGARLDINGLHADAGFGVEFLRYIAPPGGRPFPSDSRPTDLWHYQTEMEVDDLPKMLKKLEKKGFTKISNAVAKIGNAEMFLLRDPDGHAVLLKSKEKTEKGEKEKG
jgi:catechol 2,3-dioxygenase-like lactoylglutathione lyase family enzyme